MAARRLLIIMVILLGISTLATALLPPRSARDGSTTGTRATTTTTPTSPEPVPGAKALQAAITVGGKTIPVVDCPAKPNPKHKCSRIRVGDQLSLFVYSRAPTELTIPAFGLVQEATPSAPARFELLFTAARSYGIEFTDSG